MRTKPFRGYCAAGCGKPVFSRYEKAKYCSPDCAHAHKKKPRGTCLSCRAALARYRQKYCSVRCQHRFQYQQKLRQLEDGKYRTTNFVCFVRTYLIEKLGERCARCGWAERHSKTGRVPVEVEHIDGNSENNRPENLTLLCPNCHSLTDTFRALNRGRGRAKRLGGRENPLRRNAGFKDFDRCGPNSALPPT